MCAVNELREDQLVQLYIGLRDRRAKRKAEFEGVDKPDAAKMDQIEGVLLRRMQETGAESVRTKFGTAYKTTKSFASVADWDSLLDYVRGSSAWELLYKNVSKKAVEQHAVEHGEPPPGINMRSEVVVNFMRS